QAEVPLMHVSRLHVQLEVDIEDTLRKHDVGREHGRKRITSGIVQPWVIQASRRVVQSYLIAPWRAIAAPMEHRRRVVEHSICGSNRRFAVAAHIPSQSEPR